MTKPRPGTRAPGVSDLRRQRAALAADLREASTIADYATKLLDDLLPTAHAVAGDVMADGLGAGGGSEPVSGGSTNLPTEAAVQQRERLSWALSALSGELRAAQVHVRAAFNRATTLAGLAVAAPDDLAPGQGNCAACDRWVTGTPTDRIKANYCEACFKAWHRAGCPDRAAFERGRREGGEQAMPGHMA